MKSFLKSLPSHRKKEKQRKSSRSKEGGAGVDRRIRIGCARFLDQTGQLNLDYRRGEGISDMSPLDAKQSQFSESDMFSALTDEGSFVEGTQIQFPLLCGSKNLRDKDDDDIDVTTETNCPPQHSLLSTTLPPNDFIEQVKTDIYCPQIVKTLTDNNSNMEEETIDIGRAFQKRDSQENATDKTCPLDGSVRKFESSTIKNAVNPDGTDCSKIHSELSKVYSSNVENNSEPLTTMTGQSKQIQANNATFTLNNTRETMEEQGGCSDDGTHVSLELLKRSDSNVDHETKSIKPSTHVDPPRTKSPHQHQDSPAVNKESISRDQCINRQQQQLTPTSRHRIVDAEYVLSSSDIRQCIEELEEAKQLSEENSSTFDVDIDKFHSCLQQFERYVSAIGDESTIEAEDLQKIQNEEDKVFAIFDRGMNIDHCNVMFIRDVICTLSTGIDDQKGSNHSQTPQRSGDQQWKLDRLAIGLDYVFGLTDVECDSSQFKVGVTISKSPNGNGTDLCFAKQSASSKRPNHQSLTIPSHLDEILSFAVNEARSLQSQLDATRLALSKLRSHAMTLQTKALKAADHAIYADNETKFVREQFEVELCNRQSEYEMQKKTFESAKESYKADLERKQLQFDQVTDRYERELKEARDELLHLKTLRAEQLERAYTRNVGKDDISNGRNTSKHRQDDIVSFSDIANNLNGSMARDSLSSSRSHPRNIDYKSSNPVDDTDAKRKKSAEYSNTIGGNKNGNKNRTALKSHSVNSFTGKAPTKSTTVKNPYKEQSLEKTEEDFAYQEVVRKRDERMDLPGHDCEECRKFLDAVEVAGGDIDRAEIINKCSRHRSRHKPGRSYLKYQSNCFIDYVDLCNSHQHTSSNYLLASTPPHYWTLSFRDSQFST